MSKLTIKLIEFYQNYVSFDRGLLSFLTPGGACKYPLSEGNSITCSEYTKQAITQHGFTKGIWQGMQRIWRCR